MRSHGQPAARVLARRPAVQQLLLHRDAHPRHLSHLRPRRRAPRPRQPHRSSAGMPDLRRNPRQLPMQQPATPKAKCIGAGQCARCALRDDLTVLMRRRRRRPGRHGHHRRNPLRRRPTRKHPHLETLSHSPGPADRAGLRGRSRSPTTASTRRAAARHVSHLRSLLEHHGLLTRRDEHLARFESWLAAKLDAIRATSRSSPRSNSSPPGITSTGYAETPCPGNPPTGQYVRPNKRSPRPSSSSRWLDETHHRTAATCTTARRRRVPGRRADHPSSRFARSSSGRRRARSTRPCRSVTAKPRPPTCSPRTSAWPGSRNSSPATPNPALPGRRHTAAALRPTTGQDRGPADRGDRGRRRTRLRISLSARNQSPFPSRSPTCSDTTCTTGRTCAPLGAASTTHGCSPAHRAGKHLDPQSIMLRLRNLGINLLGARNSALQNLVAEVPPPLVAELLGYSYQVTHRHAEVAAQPWSQYAP